MRASPSLCQLPLTTSSLDLRNRFAMLTLADDVIVFALAKEALAKARRKKAQK